MGNSIKIKIFPGCFALTKQLSTIVSILKVLQYFNIGTVLPDNINCCGFAFRSVYPRMSSYLTYRLFATLYDEESFGVLVLCNGCYLMMREMAFRLSKDRKLLENVKKHLADEGLELKGIPRILHPVELFHDVIGVKVLRELSSKKNIDIMVASHYGCHAIRPSSVPSFDNPSNPSKLERVVEALGFKVRDYPEKLDCCGAVLLASNPTLAMKLAYNKIAGTLRWGFQLLVTTCPYCFEMLDSRQETIASMFGGELRLPVMLLAQLIGLSLGLNEHDVALNLNLSPVDDILPYIVRR